MSQHKIMLLYWLVLVIIYTAGVDSAAVALSRPQLDGRIVGGKPINISEVPYQVSLQRGFHFCGGSLIAKHFVLTAAHCATSSASRIQVRIGSTYSGKGGALVKVVKVIRHELYIQWKLDYDFALLQLEDYNEENLINGVVELPEADEDVEDSTPLTVSGWGVTQNPLESTSALRAVTVPKVNQQKCNEYYAEITERMICAGHAEGGQDACQGDSGGPLVNEDGVLVGIVSWGYGCAMPNYPGVYSRVAAVRQWITDNSGV